MKYRRLTDKEKVDTIDRYSNKLERMRDIATTYGVSRQAIYKLLRKAGVNTAKGLGGATQIVYSCTVCGREATVGRAYFRKHKHLFCGQECYFAWLKHGNGNPLIMHRHSGRIAREIVSKRYPLAPANIVHHEDRNQYNNHISNLRVFANQGDHIRYHRGFIVPILWDGRNVK